jgi:DNA-binding NarL/FixJ family response regulator
MNNYDLSPIRLIIVDDHNLFRIMLKATFASNCPDIRVVGEAENAQELFRLLPQTPADLVLLDVNLPGMSGIEIARRLRSDYPALKILAISAENTADTVKSMIEAGIDGFVSKQRGSDDELAQAIRTVMSGLEYFGRDIASIIFDLYVAKKRTTTVTPEFTDREREIIHLCRDGLMSKEIADRLGISVRTVVTHKEKIFSKLGINNTMEMVQYALKNGIIRIEN